MLSTLLSQWLKEKPVPCHLNVLLLTSDYSKHEHSGSLVNEIRHFVTAQSLRSTDHLSISEFKRRTFLSKEVEYQCVCHFFFSVKFLKSSRILFFCLLR